MPDITPLDLLRGRMADGSHHPYNAIEFLPVKDLLAFNSPSAAARSARNSEAQNMGFFAGFVTEAQAEKLAKVPEGRAAEALAVFEKAGLGKGLLSVYGNPGGLTLFFPDVRVSDYNHPEAPRTCAFRWEQADDALRSPGVHLARMKYRLQAEGIEIEAPFVNQFPG